MSQLLTPDMVRNALLQNENSGSYANAAKLSLAGGKSGYSVGAFQFDFHARLNDTTALQSFQNALQETASITGLSQDNIHSIMTGIVAVGGSPLVQPYMAQINQALQTPSGWAFITSVDASSLSTTVQTVDKLIAAANQNPNGAGGLLIGNLNPVMVSELAQYVNQFGPSVQQLTNFLSGSQAFIGDHGATVTQSNGRLDLSDLNSNFFGLTTQFQTYPQNYQHFLQSAQISGQASATGTTIDLPDGVFSSTVAQDGSVVSDVSYNSVGASHIGDSVSALNASGDEDLITVSYDPSTTQSVVTMEPNSGQIQTTSLAGPATVEISENGGLLSATGSGASVLVGNGQLEGGVGQSFFLSTASTATIDLGTGSNQVLSESSGTDIIGGNSSTVTLNGEAATVRLGNDANLTDNTSGGIDTTGGNSEVNLYGNNTTITNTGSGCTDDVHCVGDTVDGSGNQISVDGADSQVTINGGSDQISGTAGSQITVSGTNGDVDQLSGTNVVFNVADNSQANVFGSGNVLNLGSCDAVDLQSGTGFTVNGSNDTIQNESYVASSLNGSDNVVTANGTGAALQIGGNGNSVNLGSGNYADLTSGTGFEVSGSGDTVQTQDYVQGTVNGSYNNVGEDGTGASLNIGGNGNAVSLVPNNDANITWGSNVAVTGTGDTIQAQNYVSGTVTGAGNAVDEQGTGASLSIGGNGNSVTLTPNNNADLTWGNGVTVNGSDDTIQAQSYVNGTVTGSNDTVDEQGSGASISVGGMSDAVNLADNNDLNMAWGSGFAVSGGNGDTIEGQNYVAGSINGQNDTVSENGAGESLSVGGNDNTIAMQQGNDSVNVTWGNNVNVTGSGDTIQTQNYVNGTISGSGDAISESGSNANMSVGGTNDSVTLANGNAVNLASGGQFSVNGNSDTIQIQANVSGSINGANDAISESGSNVAFSVGGNSNTISLSGGDVTNLTWGQGDSISGNNSTINGSNYVQAAVNGSGNTVNESGVGDSFNVGGNNDTVNLGQNSYAGLTYGSGFTVNGNGGTINGQSYISGSINGSGDTFNDGGTGISMNVSGGSDNVNLGSKDYVGLIGGRGYNVNGSSDQVATTNGVGFSITGSGDIVSGNYDAIVVNGDSNTFYGADDSFWATGSGNGLDGAGDVDDGSADTGFDDYVYFGFASGHNALNTISSQDRALGDYRAADATDVAFQQAKESAAGALAISPGTLTNPGAEPKWESGPVTWSFAPGATTGSSAFSGAISDTQDQSVVESALQTWAEATGITFQEASNPAQADFQIGWGSFSTDETGLVGLTTVTSKDGIAQQGATVRLEDPNETALSAGNGEPIFAGTNTTLYQVALHEIGHVLGLGDNSDPDSVMYFALGSNNQTLDSTDVAAIRQLYGNEQSASSTQDSTNQSASSASAAIASSLIDASSPQGHQLLAA